MMELILYYISFPVFTVFILFEILYSAYHQTRQYELQDTLTNLTLTAFNFALDLLMRAVCFAVLYFFYEHYFFHMEKGVLYWILLFLGQDLAYYFLHRVDHFCRLFWAVHVTHHSSEKFNFTVSIRSSVFQPLYRFIYYIPLAFFGFDPIDIMFMYSLCQSYGFFIHTETVGKLGLLEYVFATPTHHKLHHASNPQYLDKNLGQVLIIWDKLFGTFVKEDEPVRYGLTKPLENQKPMHVIFHEWNELGNDLKKPVSFRDKLRYIFGPPGWSHDGSRKTSRQLREEYLNTKE